MRQVWLGYPQLNSPFKVKPLDFLCPTKVWIRGWLQVQFKGDNAKRTRIIDQVVLQHKELENILRDLRYWMSIQSIQVKYSQDNVNREQNSDVDVISNHAIDGFQIVRWLTSFIIHIQLDLIKVCCQKHAHTKKYIQNRYH